ncbi:MAG TPA: OmpA family protein, partial [bacterium]|nr:OmpA family protein [bacterium]
LSVRHVRAHVDGDPSLEDAISGFKTGLDTGLGFATSGSGFGWRAEARREFVEDAGAWSWTIGAGWWPGKTARRPVRVTSPPAAPMGYPSWMIPTVPTPPPTPAPAATPPAATSPEVESLLRQLVEDNRDLRARLDSLAAAMPARPPTTIPIPAPTAPPPAPPAASAPSTDAGTLDEAMRRLSTQLGAAGDIAQTWEGFRIRLGRRNSFASGGASLGPDLQEDIRKVALVALRFPQMRLVVEGHTDSAGTSSRNLSLSEARAWSVAEEIIRLGVERDRVSSQGLGAAAPIADNATADGRAANRRVEVRVLAGEGR